MHKFHKQSMGQISESIDSLINDIESGHYMVEDGVSRLMITTYLKSWSEMLGVMAGTKENPINKLMQESK